MWLFLSMNWYSSIFRIVVSILISSEEFLSCDGEFCQFLLFYKRLISSSFILVLIGRLFLNQSFNVSFHSFLAYMKFVDKSAVILMKFLALVLEFYVSCTFIFWIGNYSGEGLVWMSAIRILGSGYLSPNSKMWGLFNFHSVKCLSAFCMSVMCVLLEFL